MTKLRDGLTVQFRPRGGSMAGKIESGQLCHGRAREGRLRDDARRANELRPPNAQDGAREVVRELRRRAPRVVDDPGVTGRGGRRGRASPGACRWSRRPTRCTTAPVTGTPAGQRRSERDEATHAWARACIESQLDLLSRGDWTAFALLAGEVRSDFRDTGPVLAHLMCERGAAPRGGVLALRLVDYAEVLAAEPPTWVAGPLLRVAA